MTTDLAKLAAARVLVVGDVMLDRYWFGEVDRISPEAPVPIVRVTREEHRLGGAANVARNVAAFGAQVTLMTAIGDDEPARVLTRLLTEAGVKAHFGHDARLKTTVKLRVSGRAQQLVRVDFEDAPDHEVLAALLPEFETALASHDAVLFSDYGKGGLAHITTMIGMARAMGKPVLVDPKGSDYARYAGATVLTPNRSEFAQVAGVWTSEADLRARAHDLRRRFGLDAVLVTRSEDGMTLFDDAGELSAAAEAREVFDITGAGDTVIATLAALVAAGSSLREAMPLANRAGGIVVGKFGTASATYAEVCA